MIEEKDNRQDEMDGTLLFRYIRGNSTETENARIALWRKEHPDNEKILLQTAKIYHARRTRERILQRDPVSAFHKVTKRRNKKIRLAVLKRITAVAACIALLLSAVANYYFLQERKSVPQFVTVQTNAGMRTCLNLPDGTEVHLNSSAKLTYPASFDAKERRVRLDGEGYFNVAHEADRPFIVQVESKPVEVEVLGTEFNVQAYASDSLLKTTLVEGSVKFGVQNESGKWKHVVLKPSENVVYNAQANNFRVGRGNTEYDTEWRHGRLMFKDMPVPEVLMRLSHFYNVTFDVEDAVINSYVFTGTFDNRQLSQVLDYLCISSNIKYKVTSPSEDDSRGIRRTKVVLKKR
jgi:ferric-dicitrate binding protein FerR (iron transport regulator)